MTVTLVTNMEPYAHDCYGAEKLIHKDTKWETYKCELCGGLRTYTIPQPLKSQREESTKR